MKFINHIMLRITLSLSIVLGIWAVIFYYSIVDEVQDETDDVLEDYSAMIIQNFLAGEPMPSNDNGSNNTYYLRSIAHDSLEIAKRNEGFTDETIYIEYKGEDEPARVVRQIFRDADDNYYEVTVITPTIDSSDLIEAIWQSLVVLFILLLLVVLLINILAIRSSLKPLDKFMAWLHKSDIENCVLPTIKESNIREIAELSQAIKAFAERSRRAFEQQKEFIGNASHELQTPIAICQNRLELLCNSELTQQQMEDIAECLTTLSRLSKLNRSLLMLSKIENGGFLDSIVDINLVMRQNIEPLDDLYKHRNITLTIREHSSCMVKINSDLATTMVANLIKNSFVHNIDGGIVSIDINSDSVTIANSAASGALDNYKIFERFYQGGSRSGTYGLGLPITHSICKLYNFKIAYSYRDNLHHFKIIFK